MAILERGGGEFRMPDVDAHRAWMRDQKPRGPRDKLMSAREAVSRFVADGDYLSYDHCFPVRGPNVLAREIMRQGKKDLWLAAKFTYVMSTLLTAAGCVRGIDVGYLGLGRVLYRAVEEGRIKVTEWTNGMLTLRHLAGAMGVPFLPTRASLGSDNVKYSGAMVVADPFTGQPITLVPAINPDVAIVHVNQADVQGNCRIFGPSTLPQETAMAARKVIVCAEEIVDNEEIRRDPAKTTIPYYYVDAVVDAPYGAYPGDCPGLYRGDAEHMRELFASINDDEQMARYLERWVYRYESDAQMLHEGVGVQRLLDMRRAEKIREGYYR